MAKRHSQEEVELNLAAMLDMAFQLLAFFIMTFRPPPAEGQIMLRMPPPQAVFGAGNAAAGEDATKDPKDVAPVKTLTVTVAANKSGDIDMMEVGVPGVGMNQVKFESLNEKLGEYVGGSAGTFEQVIIQASPNLRWGELMRVVDECAKRKILKLSFVALPPNA